MKTARRVLNMFGGGSEKTNKNHPKRKLNAFEQVFYNDMKKNNYRCRWKIMLDHIKSQSFVKADMTEDLLQELFALFYKVDNNYTDVVYCSLLIDEYAQFLHRSGDSEAYAALSKEMEVSIRGRSREDGKSVYFGAAGFVNFYVRNYRPMGKTPRIGLVLNRMQNGKHVIDFTHFLVRVLEQAQNATTDPFYIELGNDVRTELENRATTLLREWPPELQENSPPEVEFAHRTIHIMGLVLYHCPRWVSASADIQEVVRRSISGRNDHMLLIALRRRSQTDVFTSRFIEQIKPRLQRRMKDVADKLQEDEDHDIIPYENEKKINKDEYDQMVEKACAVFYDTLDNRWRNHIACRNYSTTIYAGVLAEQIYDYKSLGIIPPSVFRKTIDFFVEKYFRYHIMYVREARQMFDCYLVRPLFDSPSGAIDERSLTYAYNKILVAHAQYHGIIEGVKQKARKEASDYAKQGLSTNLVQLTKNMTQPYCEARDEVWNIALYLCDEAKKRGWRLSEVDPDRMVFSDHNEEMKESSYASLKSGETVHQTVSSKA